MPFNDLPRFSVVITPRAEEDVRGIYEFIAADSPQGAARVFERIRHVVLSLSYMPRRFGLAREAAEFDGELRQTTVARYRIIFEIAGDTVHVLTVRHGSRQPAGDLGTR